MKTNLEVSLENLQTTALALKARHDRYEQALSAIAKGDSHEITQGASVDWKGMSFEQILQAVVSYADRTLSENL